MNVTMRGSQGGATAPSQTTVNGPETASARPAVQLPNLTFEKDSAGRDIGVCRLNGLENYRLILAMGKDANNSAALEFASVAASVRAINGEEIGFPLTKLQLEAIIQRLDTDSIIAAGIALTRSVDEAAEDGVEVAKN